MSETRPPAPGRGRRDLALLVGIAALAFALRLACVWEYEQQHPNALLLAIDERSYDRWARAIAAGDWLGSEVYFQEPLYSYALGALYTVVGPSAFAARVAQCLLWAIATFLCGLLARRLFGRTAGFVAAFGLAVYWPGLLFPCLLLKENLLLPLLFALLLAIVRTRDMTGARELGGWALVGLLAGLGALLRGNVLVLLPALCLWPIARRLLRRERVVAGLAPAACAALAMACVLLPVAWRNAHVGGVFALTTSGAGTNLYGGNALENEWGRATELAFVRGVPEHEAGDWRREAERRSGRALDAGETSSFWSRELMRSVAEHPLDHAALLARKLWITLGAYEVPDNHLLAWDAQHVPLAKLPWPGFGVLGALGLAGILLWTVRRIARRTSDVPCAGGAHELAAFFALYLATIVLTVTSDRARLPLVVALAPFAAWFAIELVRALRAARTREALAAIGALAAALLVVHVPAFTARERADDWDERDFNLAVLSLSEPEREADGYAHAARLARAHPNSARVATLLASFEHRRGARLVAEADPIAVQAGRELLRTTLARLLALADDARLGARERYHANVVASALATDLGEWPIAQERIAAARAFDPESADLAKRATRVQLARAQADFAEAQAVHAAARADAQALEAARGLAELALDRLQAVALDERCDELLRAEARTRAGWIQLWMDRLAQAERHFRAALELGAGTEARLGLAHVLVTRAERDAEQRSADLLTAEALIAGLDADPVAEEGLRDLRARISRLRE